MLYFLVEFIPDLIRDSKKKMYKKWKWYVYILELYSGYYYTGMTWKPEARFDQHLSGLGGKYTARFKVKKLVYLEEHEDVEMAREREIKIKDFSQKKKQELIRRYVKEGGQIIFAED